MTIKRIGVIIGAHGLKGDLKVKVITNRPQQRFRIGKTVSIVGEEWQLEVVRDLGSGFLLIHLLGCDQIEAAELLKGRDVEQQIELATGEFFYDDLIGFSLISSDGEKVGEVSDFGEIQGRFYLSVGEKLLPFVSPLYYSSISQAEKKIFLSELGSELF